MIVTSTLLIALLTIASFPLCTAIQKPNTHLQLRQAKWNGIQVSPFLPVSGCATAQYTNISTAILHASYLAVAGRNAAAKYAALPFSYFFQPNFETAVKVIDVFDRVIAAQVGQGPQAAALCKDPENICVNAAPGGPQLLGYSMSLAGSGGNPPSGFTPSVILCPAGLQLPPNSIPCTSIPGQKTIGELFLHEMMHLTEIIGIVANDIPKPNYQQSARNVNANMLAGVNTTNDADAYAYLGTWAWDFGLGERGLWDFNGTCVTHPMVGNLDSAYEGPNGEWYSG